MINNRLNFKQQMKFIDRKASVTQGVLIWMILNIGRPNSFKRTIISRVVTSIMVHGCDKPETLLRVSSERD